MKNGRSVFKSISETIGNSAITPSQSPLNDFLVQFSQKEVSMPPGTVLSTAIGPNGCYLTRAFCTQETSVCLFAINKNQASMQPVSYTPTLPLTFTLRWEFHYTIQAGLEPTLWPKEELNLRHLLTAYNYRSTP